MKRLKKFGYVFLAGICLLCGPALVLAYHYILAPSLGTVEVVKAAGDIKRGSIINSDQLSIKRIKLEELVEGAYQEPDEIAGKEARFNIKRGQQVIPDMIDANGLYPNPDQWNTALPSQWIYSSPGSLLRGDRVTLYAVEVKDDDLKIEDTDNNYGYTQETLSQLNNGGTVAAKQSDQAKLQAQVKQLQGIKVIDDLVVSYSKANNNSEVMSPEENRLKPTAPVSSIEVIVNQKQWDQIVQYPLKGYKFIVMYR